MPHSQWKHNCTKNLLSFNMAGDDNNRNQTHAMDRKHTWEAIVRFCCQFGLCDSSSACCTTKGHFFG